jgi:hypothetical protein
MRTIRLIASLECALQDRLKWTPDTMFDVCEAIAFEIAYSPAIPCKLLNISQIQFLEIPCILLRNCETYFQRELENSSDHRGRDVVSASRGLSFILQPVHVIGQYVP